MPASLGRYELIEVLAVRPSTELFLVRVSGEGGFSRRIALKRLRDDKLATQFIADAKLGAHLSHPKIVQIIELGSVSGVPYVAMEYVDGIDLLGLMRELARAEKLIEPAIAVWIAHEILDALEYTHGLVDELGMPLGASHGRLTPSKVLLGTNGEIKLRDFGGTRLHGLDVKRESNDYAYVAPEQVAALPSDARTDVYAVGVVLAELLIGKRLFAAANEFEVLMRVRDGNVGRFDARGSDVGLDLVDIVHTALDRRAEHRWTTAAAFRDALADWLFEHRHRVNHVDVAKIVATVRSEVDAWRRAYGSNIGPTVELDDAPKTIKPVTTLPPVKFDWTGEKAGIKPRTRTIEIPPLVRPPSATPPAPRGSAPSGTRPPATVPHAPAAAPADDMAKRRERQTVERSAFEGMSPLKRPEPPAAKPTTNEARPRLSTRGKLHPQRGAPAEPVRAPGPPADSIGAAVESILPPRTISEPDIVSVPAISPEQAALAAQLPPPILANLTRTADEAGDLSRVPALRMVFKLMLSDASGLLAVASGEVRRDLYFRNGQLAGVWSGATEDLFGSYLVTNQILSEPDVAAALAIVASSGGRLGDALVALKLLKPVEVFRHLTRHVRSTVIKICATGEGFFAWYRGAELREAFSLEVEGFSILGEAALEIQPKTLEAWITKHRETRWIPVTEPRVAVEALGLPGADAVLSLLDGVRSLDALIGRQTPETRLATARRLFLLDACDLIRH